MGKQWRIALMAGAVAAVLAGGVACTQGDGVDDSARAQGDTAATEPRFAHLQQRERRRHRQQVAVAGLLQRGQVVGLGGQVEPQQLLVAVHRRDQLVAVMLPAVGQFDPAGEGGHDVAGQVAHRAQVLLVMGP